MKNKRYLAERKKSSGNKIKPKPLKQSQAEYIDKLERYQVENGVAIQICSILPYICAEADYLHTEYQLIEFKQIYDMTLQTIALAKWSVNMLVNYKRKYTDWNDSEYNTQIYGTDVDYTKNFERDLKQMTESDLKYLGTDVHDYGEVNTDDREWMLWNFLNKINQVMKSLPKDQDIGNLKKLIDRSLSSSYRICTKLKKYTGEFTDKYLNEKLFDREFPW